MNTDERFIERNFGKERHFLVPEDYFRTFRGRMAVIVGEDATSSAGKASVRRMWFAACAAACVVILLVWGGVSLPVTDVLQDGGGVLSAGTDVNDADNGSIEQVADYMMIDNDDLYAYIAEE